MTVVSARAAGDIATATKTAAAIPIALNDRMKPFPKDAERYHLANEPYWLICDANSVSLSA